MVPGAFSPPLRYAVVRVRPLENIDRSSWLALAAVGILTILGIGATLLTSSGPAADSSTPLGVVTSYVRAVQAGDADRAWTVLAQTDMKLVPGEPLPQPVLSQDDFRKQVQSSRQPTSPRVLILGVSQTVDTATVQLEVSHASGNPLTGATSQHIALSLTRQADGWRITSDPFPWQFQ